MTFVDTDVIRVLEEVLPDRFGGSPVDYQLIEGEAEDGRPQLSLLVHPRVGPLDTRAVEEAFLGAIGTGSGAARIMAHQWRQGRMLRVEREPPRTGVLGKILHVWAPRATTANGAQGGPTGTPRPVSRVGRRGAREAAGGRLGAADVDRKPGRRRHGQRPRHERGEQPGEVASASTRCSIAPAFWNFRACSICSPKSGANRGRTSPRVDAW